MSELVKRQAATEATLAKYRDKPMSFEDGQTCVHMARFHLVKLGHKPQKMPRVRSLIGAKRALKDNGWETTADMLDAILPRIKPAEMRLGDLAVMEDDSGLGAVVISAGMGWSKVFGWHEDAQGLAIMDVKKFIGAWRG
ncbi:MAG: hypothetical protein ABJC88_17025 [Parasphingorhabdus sp.]|uniref:DUF6950 family protein n=1 Tax=Sphingomonadales TaxID=204457 RepID=UPI003262CED7